MNWNDVDFADPHRGRPRNCVNDSAVPFHLLLPAKETEVETPGPIIEAVGPELRDSERDPEAAPSTAPMPFFLPRVPLPAHRRRSRSKT